MILMIQIITCIDIESMICLENCMIKINFLTFMIDMCESDRKRDLLFKIEFFKKFNSFLAR